MPKPQEIFKRVLAPLVGLGMVLGITAPFWIALIFTDGPTAILASVLVIFGGMLVAILSMLGELALSEFDQWRKKRKQKYQVLR